MKKINSGLVTSPNLFSLSGGTPRDPARYTLMHLPEGHSFTGTMRKTEVPPRTSEHRICSTKSAENLKTFQFSKDYFGGISNFQTDPYMGAYSSKEMLRVFVAEIWSTFRVKARSFWHFTQRSGLLSKIISLSLLVGSFNLLVNRTMIPIEWCIVALSVESTKSSEHWVLS
jgi:hypothetical protein